MSKEYTLCDYDQGHIDGMQVGYELAMQRLDKIKAEARSLKISYTDHDKDTYRRGINDALQIIDKYKAEIAPQESEE